MLDSSNFLIKQTELSPTLSAAINLISQRQALPDITVLGPTPWLLVRKEYAPAEYQPRIEYCLRHLKCSIHLQFAGSLPTGKEIFNDSSALITITDDPLLHRYKQGNIEYVVTNHAFTIPEQHNLNIIGVYNNTVDKTALSLYTPSCFKDSPNNKFSISEDFFKIDDHGRVIFSASGKITLKLLASVLRTLLLALFTGMQLSTHTQKFFNSLIKTPYINNENLLEQTFICFYQEYVLNADPDLQAIYSAMLNKFPINEDPIQWNARILCDQALLTKGIQWLPVSKPSAELTRLFSLKKSIYVSTTTPISRTYASVTAASLNTHPNFPTKTTIAPSPMISSSMENTSSIEQSKIVSSSDTSSEASSSSMDNQKNFKQKNSTKQKNRKKKPRNNTEDTYDQKNSEITPYTIFHTPESTPETELSLTIDIKNAWLTKIETIYQAIEKNWERLSSGDIEYENLSHSLARLYVFYVSLTDNLKDENYFSHYYYCEAQVQGFLTTSYRINSAISREIKNQERLHARHKAKKVKKEKEAKAGPSSASTASSTSTENTVVTLTPMPSTLAEPHKNSAQKRQEHLANQTQILLTELRKEYEQYSNTIKTIGKFKAEVEKALNQPPAEHPDYLQLTAIATILEKAELDLHRKLLETLNRYLKSTNIFKRQQKELTEKITLCQKQKDKLKKVIAQAREMAKPIAARVPSPPARKTTSYLESIAVLIAGLLVCRVILDTALTLESIQQWLPEQQPILSKQHLPILAAIQSLLGSFLYTNNKAPHGDAMFRGMGLLLCTVGAWCGIILASDQLQQSTYQPTEPLSFTNFLLHVYKRMAAVPNIFSWFWSIVAIFNAISIKVPETPRQTVQAAAPPRVPTRSTSPRY